MLINRGYRLPCGGLSRNIRAHRENLESVIRSEICRSVTLGADISSVITNAQHSDRHRSPMMPRDKINRPDRFLLRFPSLCIAQILSTGQQCDCKNHREQWPKAKQVPGICFTFAQPRRLSLRFYPFSAKCLDYSINHCKKKFNLKQNERKEQHYEICFYIVCLFDKHCQF